MAWSVMMFVLYKEIEGWGLRDFARLSLRKKIRAILSMYDLNKIDDSDIIQSSHEIGFFDQNIRNKLIDHAKTRNSCGHVSQASISNYTVFEFVNDILDYSKIITSLNERDALTILQSLKNMDTSKLEETIKNMSLRKLLIVLDKLMDRISTITEHQEFLESSNLFECVRLSFKTRSSEEDRVQIFDRIFTRLSSEKIKV